MKLESRYHHQSLNGELRRAREYEKHLTEQKEIAKSKGLKQKQPYQIKTGDVLYFPEGLKTPHVGGFYPMPVPRTNARYFKVDKITRKRDWGCVSYELKLKTLNSAKVVTTLNVGPKKFFWAKK